MNRHSVVWTVQSNVNTVMTGPFALTPQNVEKHKYSIMVHNFGNHDLVFTPQYFHHASWRTCQNVGQTSPAGPYTLVAKAEQMVEFMFDKGSMFRVIGYGVPLNDGTQDDGVTDGRLEMIEVDFESNINDR